MTVETFALALLLGLLVAACGPISMQSSERECYEAAAATARASEASLAPASPASEHQAEALKAAEKWRKKACGR